jgi:hypothetical protein
MEKYVEYAAPQNPKAAIIQFRATTCVFTSPLNSIKYKNGGSINAMAAEPIDPAILRKSVKFGISSEIPVISHTIIDLAITFLTLFCVFVRPL